MQVMKRKSAWRKVILGVTDVLSIFYNDFAIKDGLLITTVNINKLVI